MVTCSKLPSEDGSVISDESERLRSGRGLMVLKVTAQQRATKEEARKKDGEHQVALRGRGERRTASSFGRFGGVAAGKGQGRRSLTGPKCCRACRWRYHQQFWSWYGVRSANSRDGRDEHALVTHRVDITWCVSAGCYGAVTTKQRQQKHSLMEGKN